MGNSYQDFVRLSGCYADDGVDSLGVQWDADFCERVWLAPRLVYGSFDNNSVHIVSGRDLGGVGLWRGKQPLFLDKSSVSDSLAVVYPEGCYGDFIDRFVEAVLREHSVKA